ncbi:MAG: type III pantothenate kinase [Simkaniaceae bacterium]|nr:type III pantothenate kinase [Candidatus Sacchlamyda saccharinae]
MDLVIDVGNFRIKGAFFEGDQVVDLFVVPPTEEALKGALSGRQAERVLISTVSEEKAPMVGDVLTSLGFSFELLDFSNVKVELDVDEPEAVGHDRIANVYGALYRFPVNDCIVVDLGTAVTFDYVGCTGKYLGGAIYPGLFIGAKALSSYTSKLPKVEVAKPEAAIAKTTKTHIQSGLYWGLLGAIERITFEMRTASDNPSNVKVLATGGLLKDLPELADDLSELTDLIDPHLTLIGIHEILKER